MVLFAYDIHFFFEFKLPKLIHFNLESVVYQRFELNFEFVFLSCSGGTRFFTINLHIMTIYMKNMSCVLPPPPPTLPQINNGETLIMSTSENFFSFENVKKEILSQKGKPSYSFFVNVSVKLLRDGAEFLTAPMHKLMNIIYDKKRVPDL